MKQLRVIKLKLIYMLNEVIIKAFLIIRKFLY